MIIESAEQLVLKHLLHFLYGFSIRGLLREPFVDSFFCNLFDTRLEHTFYILEGRIADIYFQRLFQRSGLVIMSEIQPHLHDRLRQRGR